MRRAPFAACVAAAGLLAACSASSSTASGSSDTPTAPESTPVTTVTDTVSPSPSPSATSPSASASPSPTRQAQQRSTCTSLQIRVIRGSGVTGREFAALQFTNTGSSSCTLYGYPTVTLQLGGERIGTASRPAGAAASSRELAPGDTAESQLNDYVMNCNADLSDAVHVVAPGSTLSTTRPDLKLRACTLRTSPLGAPE